AEDALDPVEEVKALLPGAGIHVEEEVGGFGVGGQQQQAQQGQGQQVGRVVQRQLGAEQGGVEPRQVGRRPQGGQQEQVAVDDGEQEQGAPGQGDDGGLDGLEGGLPAELPQGR